MHEAAIEHLSQSDKVLARLIRRVGACRLEARRSASPFQALVQSVAHQQLNGTAAKTLEGIVPSSRAIARMSNEEILERLTAIRGVGPWTVEMLLIFTLGRLDILPATDFGVRKGFALTYRRKELPAPSELLKHGERWRPYRTIASWYLWRALDGE